MSKPKKPRKPVTLREKARVFRKAWIAWIGKPDNMPDEATIEASWDIVHHLERNGAKRGR